ncbi:MAG: hypothetical protein GX257_00835 [Clostridiales bacterium]|jgi:hypothetical protein|nr:hypothetical protein [Clostridiales bacterium]
MAFAMKFNMVDVIVSDSLENCYVNGKRVGFQFDIRLDYYRGQFLSVIEELEVTVNGEKIDTESIRFRLHDKEFGVCQLETCCNEFWRVTEPATIFVRKGGGLPEGEHDIELRLMFRSPYMAIGPNKYMPVDNCGTKKLRVKF